MMDELINRVEKSNLVSINLDEYYPQGDRVMVDIKENLHENIVLIEKDFRSYIQTNDWSVYKNKYVGIICSADAIVPLWAFMLMASKIKPFAKKVVFGNNLELEKVIFQDVIAEIDFLQFKDKNVILKGCGIHPIPEAIFVEFMLRLQDYAKSVMFGEACSAVPLYKRKKRV